jgi:Secretion system C-terminal sorting domain
MKHFYSLLFLFCLSFNVYSQATDYITGLDHPEDILVYDGELYIAERVRNRIIKVDLSNPNPTPEVVITGRLQLSGFALNGTELYFSQGPGPDIISKIDLTDPNPTPIVVLENIRYPKGLAFKGNDLYISQFYDDKILKADVSLQNPIAIEFLSNIEAPSALEFVSDDLYFIEHYERKIFKTDITDPIPTASFVIGASLPVGLSLRGNYLYIAEAGGSIGDDLVSKIDITIQNPTKIDVVTGLYNPTFGLAHYDDVLYIAENFKISKFELPPLSTADFYKEKVSALPNPTSDFFEISGLNSPVEYSIYNISGTILRDGIVDNKQKIDIQYFPAGLYFLILEDSRVIKILKE